MVLVGQFLQCSSPEFDFCKPNILSYLSRTGRKTDEGLFNFVEPGTKILYIHLLGQENGLCNENFKSMKNYNKRTVMYLPLYCHDFQRGRALIFVLPAKNRTVTSHYTTKGAPGKRENRLSGNW